MERLLRRDRALAAVALLLSGGYKRIELLTTFLVVSVTLVTVACVLALPCKIRAITGLKHISTVCYDSLILLIRIF